MSDVMTVRPVGVAVLGRPDPCPKCGGHLGLAFGVRIEADGRRYAVIDPAHAYCRDCRTIFKVRAE